MKYAYKALAFLFLVVKWLFVLIFFITVIGTLASFFQDFSRFGYLKYLTQLDKTINDPVHQILPTQFGTKDISHVLTLIISFIGFVITRNFQYDFSYKAHLYELKEPSADLKKLAETKEGAKKLVVLDQKMETIQKASRKDREKLLKEYIDIKKQLESMGRNLAFLSVDIVDSTKMKESEDPIQISYDFVKYREMVERHLNANGCIKSTWTPDGLMACFNKLDEAFTAAQGIIKELIEFNRSVKSIKSDFAVRCGINAGYLLFDETLPLEQITDRVIDIAGHMQKYAVPNTIFMPKNLVIPIKMPEHFEDHLNKIDDLEVTSWTVKSSEK